MNKISTELIKYFKQQVAQANTDKIISKLLNLDIDYENELVLISNKWSELRRQKISGSISEETYSLKASKINNSLLLLLDELSKDLKQIEFNSKQFISVQDYNIIDEKYPLNGFTIDSLVLLNMFGSEWQVNECMVGLKIENQIIDYLIITGQSGMHEFNLVKIGHAELNILDLDGSLNIRLKQYIKEVKSWRNWIWENYDSFKKLLSKRMISSYGATSVEHLSERRRGKPTVSCNIFYGVRESFSKRENEFRIELFEEQGIQMIPYNRIGEVKQKKRSEWWNHG